MLLASVFGRKHRLFDPPPSGYRHHRSRYRLLRIETLDDRVLLAITTASVPDDISTGPATSPMTPLSSTFFDVLPVAAPALPGTPAQTAFPTPDLLLSGVPAVPTPVFVPVDKSWVFQAGGGGFVAPPIDNASDNDYPVALESTPGGTGVSVVLKPAFESKPVIDSALASFEDVAPKAQAAGPSTADELDAPDLYDAALASAGNWLLASASPLEVPQAEALASP